MSQPPADPVSAPASEEQAPNKKMSSSVRTTVLGAMFLMATSAIGPGFITQTTTFTVQLGAAFAFAIMVSIVVDIALQLNVWRVIGVSGRRAQELGNLVFPGLGWAMAVLLVFGGFAFNIGNVSGSGLGVNAMLGLDPRIGGVLSAAIAIGIFLSKRAGVAMDRIVVGLGLLMIALTTYIAISSGPPVVEVLKNVVFPEQVSFLAITTIIGGSIGGYVVYAGAHRLLDSGISGAEHVAAISRSSIAGILITGVMRVALFLAILGVVSGGAQLDPANPVASAFKQAAGEFGLRAFGVVLWIASITSVIGASYTTVTFVTSRAKTSARTITILVCGFIGATTLAYVSIGAPPVTLLVFAGAFNGLLLPFGIGLMFWVGTFRADLLNGYVYPKWLLGIGWVAWLITTYLAVNSIRPLIALFF